MSVLATLTQPTLGSNTDKPESLPFLDLVSVIPFGYYLGGADILPSSPADAKSYLLPSHKAFSSPISSIESPSSDLEMDFLDNDLTSTPILQYFGNSPQLSALEPATIVHPLLQPIETQFNQFVDTSDIFHTSSFMHGFDFDFPTSPILESSPVLPVASTASFIQSIPSYEQLFSLETSVATVDVTVPKRVSRSSSSDSSPSTTSSNKTSPSKKRTQLSKEQRAFMMSVFEENNMPSTKTLQKVSEKVGMELRLVQYWFQNRRAAERRRHQNSN
ncbi:hypothetical protein BDR26DRAFT_29188 [Obelidium mucronatum]|nr:hypothetical protein BDR26DRAFT_29188 [Obelidium mucronatum]